MDPFSDQNKFFERLDEHILLNQNGGVLDLSEFADKVKLTASMFEGIKAESLIIKLPLSYQSDREKDNDLSAINYLNRLKSIEIVNFKCRGIDFSNFPHLERILMRSTRIPDLQGVEDCFDLQEISVTGSKISSLPSLERLTKLARLNISSSKVSKIENIGIVPSLVSLEVSRTNVADINHIMRLPRFFDLSAKHLGFQDTPSALFNNPMRMLSGMKSRDCAKQTVMYLKGEHPDFTDFSGIPKNIATILSEASPVEISSKSGKIAVDNIGPTERNNPIELSNRLHALKAHVDLLIKEAAFVQCPPTVSRRLNYLVQAFNTETPVYFVLETHSHLLSATIEDQFTAEMIDAPLLDSIKRLAHSVQQLKPFMMPPPDLEAVALEAVPSIKDDVSPQDFLAVAEEAHKIISSEELEKDFETSVVDTAASFRDSLEDPSIKTAPRSFKKVAARLSGFISLLSNAATLHSWFATYAVGLNVVNQLQDLLKKLISFFN